MLTLANIRVYDRGVAEPDSRGTRNYRGGGERRDEILDAAAVLFASRGFHGVSIDDLGASVGLSGPAIYRHFASKEDVLAQMLLRISRHLHDGGARCVTSASSAPSALDGLLRFHASFALAQPSLIVVHGRELPNVPEPARHEIRRLQRAYVERWVGVLAELSPQVPVSRLRVAVHAAFGLLNSTPYALGGTVGPDPAETADLLVTMARAALLTSG
ncbi:MAG: TetR/AcrR family transcriptional regulator [Nocardiopsaceae bacterium]|nr:TetR/AcrR family transcriptional regulator [Nocardiopsaceae bacterium]